MRGIKSLSRIVTLGGLTEKGSKLTCSYRAAKAAFPDDTIITAGSFEIGRNMVINSEAEYLYVPAAYLGTVDLLMDPYLKVVKTMLQIIPELVIASRYGNRNDYSTVYSHPTPSRLLHGNHFFHQNQNTIVHVESNSDACESHLLDQDSLCVTNMYCVEEYELSLIYVLRESKEMPFITYKLN